MSTEHEKEKDVDLPETHKHENTNIRHSHGGKEHIHDVPVVETRAVVESVVEETSAPVSPKRISVKAAMMVAVVVILVALGYSYRGIFVAATVNGSPISRLAVIRELEKTSGKATLESLITKQLILSEAQKQGIIVTPDEIATDIKKIEDEISAQGKGSLDLLLAQQGMTRADLEGQMMLQKQIEKMLGEKVTVTPEEVDQYLEQTKTQLPKGNEAEARTQIMEKLKQQKLSQEGQAFLGTIRKDATINYILKY